MYSKVIIFLCAAGIASAGNLLHAAPVAYSAPATSVSYSTTTTSHAAPVAAYAAAPVAAYATAPVATYAAAPVATYAAAPVASYAAPVVTKAVAAPIATYATAPAAAVSYQSVSSHTSPVAYAAAAPVIAKSYAAPLVASTYAAPVLSRSYAAPVVTRTHAAPVVTYAAAPSISYAAPAISYAAAPAVSYGYGGGHGWIALRSNVGGPESPRRRLYAGVLRSMALYGAPIWVDALTIRNSSSVETAESYTGKSGTRLPYGVVDGGDTSCERSALGTPGRAKKKEKRIALL
ncbi:cuticle protein 16.5-like [Nymphalis io]|uniref:cuticle protein 16.5-like n=1 Tax=Inachis io TaxID=171585 RepID=UPI0021696B4C|nr:cuticle protein 16.5-like [Nymphalis io]